MRLRVVKSIPVIHGRIQLPTGGILPLEQQVVVCDPAPPLPAAFFAEFMIGGRRADSSPPKHCLMGFGRIDRHVHFARLGRKQPEGHRTLSLAQLHLMLGECVEPGDCKNRHPVRQHDQRLLLVESHSQCARLLRVWECKRRLLHLEVGVLFFSLLFQLIESGRIVERDVQTKRFVRPIMFDRKR